MKIHSTSSFKNPITGRAFLEDWNTRAIAQSGTAPSPIVLQTALGDTHVWRTGVTGPAPALLIFPGFRTCTLFWELDGLLAPLRKRYQIYLVDTNGQPTLSTGNTPDIKGPDYGIWAAEVLDKLSLPQASIMGASFGGLVCLKLATVAPQKVARIFLLNPGCLAPFSLSPRNLFYNLLPILFPSEANVRRFLNAAVLHKPTHMVSPKAEDLVVEYEKTVLKQWKDKAQKPYPMKPAELSAIKTEVHLLLGDQDPLFPYRKSEAIARAHLPNLASVTIFPGVAHGIELHAPVFEKIAQLA